MIDLQTLVQDGNRNMVAKEKTRLLASIIRRDALRYEYLLNCDFLAAKKYIPLLDEQAYKSMLRCKHDKAMGS